MDALDRVEAPARDLVARVDDTLAASGAPAGHRIWPLLRRVGALVGDAVAAIVALAPDPLRGCAADLRQLAGEHVRLRATAGEPGNWTGAAAEAYADRWRDLGGFLGGSAEPGEESLAGRLAATAGYLDDVADWMTAARLALAEALAAALCSAEAVALRSPAAAERSVAAATIGAHVLAVAAGECDRGQAVHDRWAGRLDELPYRAAASSVVRAQGGTTTVSL